MFLHPSKANKDGLLAVGGDLSQERLLAAYNSGIFPWYEEDQPILWWSPNPRMVLFLEDFKVSKSLKKTIRDNHFSVTFNTKFKDVITNCATITRGGQKGTWITEQMIDAYSNLYKKGHILSVEVWQGKELVGGLYGVDLQDKKIYCGESMFSKVSDASKVGLYYLVNFLKVKKYRFIDCQMYTPHLESLGAKEIEREQFLKCLE
ncbi:leucyl/phenylalanyl-tRNA--protein transferase [Patiriisocius hiemis]|uniref:Leucyl/phenylalanyl-tRNA--protein transferase n=1 Tax=Patiriisocius hiemis TaxID=3075604 RepID=A0ABU2YE03_9FLAO|nr:leucyl/phenylalanyl-tRNA--protein transferase [Constantimarinum sp. W242]MDT0556411.1 leucyl/phenylalanyl-tRNA--protein transferase [Constantimarinum sp. W242]